MKSRSNFRILTVFVLTVLLVGLLALVQVRESGADQEILRLILRSTARFALLIYLLVFATRPWHQLWPSNVSRWLLKNRPLIGVGFSGVMTVHLAFIVWLRIFVMNEAIPPFAIIAGGGAYLLLFLMLITTFNVPKRALGPKNWRRLHKTGLYWMGIVFANTIVPDIIVKPTDTFYLTVVVMAMAAIAIRSLAFVRRYRVTTESSA